MKDFEPTDDFVLRVMADVRAYEVSRKTERLFSVRRMAYLLPVGGILLAIVNMVRLVFMFISPALCR